MLIKIVPLYYNNNSQLKEQDTVHFINSNYIVSVNISTNINYATVTTTEQTFTIWKERALEIVQLLDN